ncbi:MAG: MoxR family ATPase [Chloroflexota bacterium]
MVSAGPSSAIAQACRPVVDAVAAVVVGNPRVIERTMVAALVGGHILIEDVPGIGKTTLAKAFARAVGGTFSRIQCTPDLLPSDVTGVHVLDQRQGTFSFQQGPVFANVLLVDELNRATPRTQAALLEAMEERQVTIEGTTRELPRPFLVLATQNPVELEGTFPLPEAQLDRFLMRLRLGYPSAEEEESIVLRFEASNPLDSLNTVLSPARLVQLQDQVALVRVEASVRRYALALVRATREHASVRLGASPRASLALHQAARALAALRGRDYLLPDDVKELASPVLAHRLMLNSQARLRGKSELSVLDEIVETTPVPVD